MIRWFVDAVKMRSKMTKIVAVEATSRGKIHPLRLFNTFPEGNSPHDHKTFRRVTIVPITF